MILLRITKKFTDVSLSKTYSGEGIAISNYKAKGLLLKGVNVKVSKLAHGLPVGGEIENLDDGTLFSAFKNRNGVGNNAD